LALCTCDLFSPQQRKGRMPKACEGVMKDLAKCIADSKCIQVRGWEREAWAESAPSCATWCWSKEGSGTELS